MKWLQLHLQRAGYHMCYQHPWRRKLMCCRDNRLWKHVFLDRKCYIHSLVGSWGRMMEVDMQSDTSPSLDRVSYCLETRCLVSTRVWRVIRPGRQRAVTPAVWCFTRCLKSSCVSETNSNVWKMSSKHEQRASNDSMTLQCILPQKHPPWWGQLGSDGRH